MNYGIILSLTLIATILLAALTKAEIIDRFRAAPVTQLDGLVQVYGDCPADMRRDFQLPVASFTSGIWKLRVSWIAACTTGSRESRVDTMSC